MVNCSNLLFDLNYDNDPMISSKPCCFFYWIKERKLSYVEKKHRSSYFFFFSKNQFQNKITVQYSELNVENIFSCIYWLD